MVADMLSLRGHRGYGQAMINLSLVEAVMDRRLNFGISLPVPPVAINEIRPCPFSAHESLASPMSRRAASFTRSVSEKPRAKEAAVTPSHATHFPPLVGFRIDARRLGFALASRSICAISGKLRG